MTFLIFAILVALSLVFGKSKTVFNLILLFMWCMFTFCYGMVDDATYMAKYNGYSNQGSVEVIFRFLIKFCNSMGLNFAGFRGTIGLVFIVLIGYVVWKTAKHPNFVLILFFLYPFTMYTVQIRSALANAILTVALTYLFKPETKNRIKLPFAGIEDNDLKYIILVLIATCIHTQSFFFIIFLLVKKNSTKNIVKLTVLMNLVIGFVITPGMIVKVLNMFGAGNRLAEYLTVAYKMSSYRKYGPILYIVFAAVVSCGTCIYLLKLKINDFDRKKIEVLLKINILSLSILAIFFRYTPEIYRIQEGILLTNYIYLTNEFRSATMLKIRKRDFKLGGYVILLCVGYLWLSVLHYLSGDVWIPFWYNNTLFW